MTDYLQDTFGTNAGDVIARLLTIALILFITWLVRRVVTAIIPSLIARFTRRTESRLDDQFITALRPPLRFVITVAGLWLVVLALELPENPMRVLRNVLDALTAFAVFWAVFRLVDPLVALFWLFSRRTVPEEQVSTLLEKQIGDAMSQIIKGLVFVLGFAAIMESWGYDIAGLIAGLGLAGAAVALAVKDTLTNLFGYFVILADEPLREGEYVVFNGVSGIVEHIGFRSTRIRVLDQSLVTVPNNTIMNANITNWSRLTRRRLNMTLGIEYRNSPEQVLSVVQAIRKMLNEHELVEPDSVIVQFITFNDSSLDILIICFVNTPDWGDFQAAKQDINLRIMHILDERGVSVAFPSRSVFVEEVQPPDESEQVVIPPPEPEPTTGTATDSPVPPDAAN
jgi:MscS family membrane protein